jgi:hypothetical protein
MKLPTRPPALVCFALVLYSILLVAITIFLIDRRQPAGERQPPVMAAVKTAPAKVEPEVSQRVSRAPVEMTFTVVDVADRKPISLARVVVENGNLAAELGDDSEAVTWSDGMAFVHHNFFLWEQGRGDERSCRLTFQGPWIHVSAEGYEPRKMPISELIGEGYERRKTPTSARLKEQREYVRRKLEAVVTMKRAASKSPSLEELADVYQFGDGFTGSNLEVSRDGRFHYQWYQDVITHKPHENDQNESRGACSVVDGCLRLLPEGPYSSHMRAFLPNDFVPVRWGGRTYLVPEKQGLHFCSVVNRGDMPTNMRNGPFVMVPHRSGERPQGLPDIPAEWRPFLLKEPLTGKIIELLPHQVVVIDVGTKVGLKAGMEICCEHPPDHGAIKILFAEADRCFARSTRAPACGLPDSSVLQDSMFEPFFWHPLIFGEVVWSLSSEARLKGY